MPLTLSRRVRESIVITVPPSNVPTRIRVEVTDIDRNKCKLLTVAPDEVTVNREEVQAEIDRERDSERSIPNVTTINRWDNDPAV